MFVEAGRFGLWEDGLLTGRHVVRVQVGRNHFAPGAKKYLFCRSGKALRAQKITFEKEYSLLRKQSARGNWGGRCLWLVRNIEVRPDNHQLITLKDQPHYTTVLMIRRKCVVYNGAVEVATFMACQKAFPYQQMLHTCII